MITDPIIQKLIKKYPPPNYIDRSSILFERLIDAIISQQLSVKAADTIFLRFKNLFGDLFPNPEIVLQKTDQELRSVGLSFAKVAYIKSIAKAFSQGKIDVEQLKRMSDTDVITELTKLKGVGKWTAEMILISTLNRPDVFSLGDLGLRRAIENLYGITDLKEIETLTNTWRPYRSTVCWYLWRSLDNVPSIAK